MKLEFKWSRLESFSALGIHEIIKAREAVFVVEQNCPYQETDDIDLHAWHLSTFLNGEFVAYSRVVDPGVKYKQPSIGRVMTLKKFRKLKIGRLLVEEAIRFTELKFPEKEIKIGAQVYLQNFYESLGFQSISKEPYDEDGILHIDMIKKTNSDA